MLACGQSLEFNLRLQNTTSSRVADVRMEAAIPLSLDARAYDWKVESPSPFVIEGENVVFSVGDFAPYQVKHVKVYFEGVGTKAERAVTSELDTYPLTTNPSPELLALAASFAGLSHQEKIRAIYRWMVENIAFTGIDRQVEGANAALSSKSGDCTEHMLLAGELLARNGIKVRRVFGVALPQNKIKISPVFFHDWLEVFDEKAWVLFDSAYKTYGMPSEINYTGLSFYQGGSRFSHQAFKMINSKDVDVFLE